MANLVNLMAEAGASMLADDTQATLTLSNNAGGIALELNQGAVVGAPSVALLRLNASGASVAIMEFQRNAFVSAVSIVFAASANWAGLGGFRVKLSDGTTYGWVPILPPAVFTAAAA